MTLSSEDEEGTSKSGGAARSGNPNPKSPKRSKKRLSGTGKSLKREKAAAKRQKKAATPNSTASDGGRGRSTISVAMNSPLRGRSSLRGVRSRSGSCSAPPLSGRFEDEINSDLAQLSEEEQDEKQEEKEQMVIDSESDYSSEEESNEHPPLKKRTPAVKSIARETESAKKEKQKQEEEKSRHLDSLEEKWRGNSKEGKTTTGDDVSQKRHDGKESIRQRRAAINCCFASVCRHPPESMWGGRSGVMARIRRFLLLPSGRSYLRQIERTIRTIMLFKAKKERYLGERKPRKAWTHYYTQADSFEANLMAKMTRQDRRNNFVKAMKRGKVRMSNDIQATAEALAETAEPGVPRIIDHRNNPDCRNPWKSRYGDDWQQKMQESPEPKKTVSVRDLVEHMVRVGEETYKGTRHEHRWGFYHDALSLMCSRANLKWMKDKGYLKCWTLPQNDLNTMFSHYKKPMPVGNHAGGMPWDQSCNKDHDDTVLRHVAATIRLREDDERKFSLRTPKKVASAYKRMCNNPPELRNGKEIIPLGEGGPEPHRLGHDIMEVPKCWRGVFDGEGLNCNSNVGGNRNKDLSEGRKAGKKVKGKWGGDKGVKKGKMASIKSSWHHPDAREALDDFLKKSHQDFEKERTIEKYDNIREEDELEEAVVEEEAATTTTTTTTDDDIDISSGSSSEESDGDDDGESDGDSDE